MIRNALQGLINEWNATEQPLQQRGGVLPLGIYEDGSVHLAWPGMITDTLDAFERAGQGPGMQNPEDAFIIGGSLGVGGLAAPRPRNALASNSVRQEAPAAPIRAYHGTGSPIVGGKFDAELSSDIGPHFGGMPDQANYFARGRAEFGQGGVVYPVDLDFKNPVELPDLYTWQPWKVADEIERLYPQHSGISDQVRGVPHEQQKRALLDALRLRGIDGIKYANAMQSEGIGPSFIGVAPNTVRSAITGETLFSNPKESALAPAAVNALADDTPRGITAYHGSPHDFDRFKSPFDDQLPKGAGRMFGDGIYLSSSEKAAMGYRDALARSSPDAGRVYRARIDAKPEQMLDLDAPIGQQSEAIRAAFQGIADDADVGLIALQKLAENEAAKNPFSRLNTTGNAPPLGLADKALAAKGVIGKKNAASDGATNYAVFDENLIDILEKYANPWTSAPLGLAPNAFEDPRQALINRLAEVY